MGKEINYLERRKKSGFFFSLDSFMGLILFILTLALVYSFFIGSHSLEQEFFISEDFLNIFTNVKVSDIDTSRYSGIKCLIDNNIIKDTNLIILEEASILQEKNKDYAKYFITDLTYQNPASNPVVVPPECSSVDPFPTDKGLVPVQYDIDILLPVSVYEKTTSDVSTAVLTRQRLISKPETPTTSSTTSTTL